MEPTAAAALPDRFRVLLLDSDDAHVASLTSYLERSGLRVTRLADGREGLAEALRGGYDVVVLELVLPSFSGLEICQRLRASSQVPVLVLSSRSGEADRVRALESGADDFLAKPASPRELLAWLRALVRRGRSDPSAPGGDIRVGPLHIALASHSASLSGRRLLLTSTEFTLLRVLAERAGHVLTREQLLDLVRGSGDTAIDRSVDTHICHLRHKMGEDPRAPRLLRTIRGAGYLLASDRDLAGWTRRRRGGRSRSHAPARRGGKSAPGAAELDLDELVDARAEPPPRTLGRGRGGGRPESLGIALPDAPALASASTVPAVVTVDPPCAHDSKWP